VRRALGSLAHQRITILGRAFKSGTDDIRDNLTDPLVNLLDREGARTAIYDPVVAQHADVSVLAGSDAVILMTAHDAFKSWTPGDLVARCGRSREEVFVFDLWNVWPWADRIFGRGSEYESARDGSVGLAHAGRRPATP
jgi:UDP-N-acetyl-D-mannosaminuronate dehydrogenase